MTAPYTGRCACGAVTLEIAGEPLATRQCWCRQCQRSAGGGAMNNALFKTKDVSVTGELCWSEYVAASGNPLHQGFCGRCGTPVLGWPDAQPHLRIVRFGALDQGHGLRPDTAIWTSEAPDWALIDPAMERHETQPAGKAKQG